MELRKRVRHRLAADAVFTWEGAEHTPLYGEGIQLEVSLLPLDGGSRTLRFKTAATVIRVEHANAGGDEGFAVVLEGLGLTEGGKVPPVDQ